MRAPTFLKPFKREQQHNARHKKPPTKTTTRLDIVPYFGAVRYDAIGQNFVWQNLGVAPLRLL